MQWEWDGSDLERTALTCNMANGPTVWDLCLQVFAACFGLGFLRLMMWRLLKDQEELRNERRRARLEQQQQLLEYFEQRWPPTTEEDEHFGRSTTAAVSKQRQEGDAMSFDSDAEAVPCSICMQPLVDLPELIHSTAEHESTGAVPVVADSLQSLLWPSTPVRGDATRTTDVNDCGGGRVVESACPGAHRFHRGCLRGWVRRGRSSCPICKLDVRGPDVGALPAAD